MSAESMYCILLFELTPTTDYSADGHTLALHDALPISYGRKMRPVGAVPTDDPRPADMWLIEFRLQPGQANDRDLAPDLSSRHDEPLSPPSYYPVQHQM